MKQSKNIKAKLIGQILLEAQYITKEQLEIALHIQHTIKKVPLGQILLELMVINQVQLEEALKMQARGQSSHLVPDHG